MKHLVSLTINGEPRELADKSVAGLATDLDAADFRLGEFEIHERAISGGMDARARADTD